MAIVKTIVEAYDGSVQVASAPWSGTTFRVRAALAFVAVNGQKGDR